MPDGALVAGVVAVSCAAGDALEELDLADDSSFAVPAGG